MHRISALRDKAEMLVPPLPWDSPQWQDCGGPPVVLLHGLWRGWHAMEPLARALNRGGFSTLNLPYPSTRLPIPALVERIRQAVDEIAGASPIHFITHSLGGIIVRALVAAPLPWKVGRIVMLAPPNGGSEIVDWSQNHPLLQFMLGPAGRALGTHGVPQSLPPLPANSEVAVIMGKRCSIPIFRNLLATDNDGIVSAERGKVQGLRGFTVIDADHTFIQMHPEAIRLSLEFLKTGTWPAKFNSATD